VVKESEVMETWLSFYDVIELTEQEKEAAILEAKVRKYFREKNAQYWAEQNAKVLEDGESVRQL
jgi:protein tyrosine phosphatase